MDVQCPTCHTVYELEESQVRSSNVTLKCSQCGLVFRLEASRGPVQEHDARWMVRDRESGDVRYLSDFQTLHRWIMEQKVRETDEISRTGGRWMLLADVGELAPVFHVVRSIQSIAGEGASAGRDPKRSGSGPTPGRAPSVPPRGASAPRQRVQTSIQFGVGAPKQGEVSEARGGAGDRRGGSNGPGATLPPGPRSRAIEEPIFQDFDESFPTDGGLAHSSEQAEWGFSDDPLDEGSLLTAPPSRRAPWWMAGIVVLGAVAAGGYFLAVEREGMEAAGEEVVGLGVDSDAGSVPEPTGVELVSRSVDASREAARQALIPRIAEGVTSAQGVSSSAREQAVAAAEKEARGPNPAELLSSARSKLERGNAVVAGRLFRKVLTAEPKNVAAITGLGWVAVAEKNTSEAARRFKEALALDAGYGDAYIGLGTAERQRGRFQAAYDAYDQYLGRFPRGEKASIARYQLEQISRQLGR